MSGIMVKLFLAICLICIAFVSTMRLGIHIEADGLDFQPPEKSNHPKLGRHLSSKADVYQGSYWSSSVELTETLTTAQIQDLVSVRIRYSENLEEIVDFLLDTGANVLFSGEGVIYADIPVHILASISSIEGIDKVIYGHKTIYPAVVSEGSTLHNASAWNALSYRGNGIKIGIIDGGFEDFSSLMGIDLPGSVIARCVTSSTSYTNNLSDCETDSKHGTAVAEAIFDIAPEADFYIANAIYGPDIREATDWMVENGVDVINMSMGQSIAMSKGDGSSPYYASALNAIDDAVEAGIIWINSAGNGAKSTWYGTDYKDTDSDGWVEIDHENYLSTQVEENCMSLSNDDSIQVGMRWDDDWSGPVKDLDVYLYLGNNEVAGSDYQQSGNSNQDPTEEFVFTSNSAGTYCLRIFDNTPNNKPDWIQLQVHGSQLTYYGDNLTQNSAHSIGSPGESSNSGMLAVGATHPQNTSEIAAYSSQGPTVDGRLKPGIVGIANANSAIWGNWMGTSQSSPHIAGLSALILERYPGYTPQQVTSYLKDNAISRGSTVPNNTWGYGLGFLPNVISAPGAPTDVSATPNNVYTLSTSTTISWSPPAANGGAPITLYTVTSSPDNLTATTTGTSTTLTGFTYGTQYRFTVTATNSAGSGPASDSSNPIISVTQPGIPTSVSATGGNAQATVSWTEPSYNGGAPITQYTVTSSPGGITTTENVPGIDYIGIQKDGVGGVDGLDGAYSVTVSPDGNHVYAGGYTDDAIAVFSRNSSTGALTYVEIQKIGVGGVDGIRAVTSVVVSPDGKHVYATGSHDDAVAVFTRNSSTGALTYLERQKDGVNNVDGLGGAYSVMLSPDGNHVYVTGRSDHAVAVFSRNSFTGALTYVEMQKDGVNGVDGLEGAKYITVSPDGNHVYTAAWDESALTVFSRNSSTGGLTYVEMQKDGVNGVDGLKQARSVTVSPDGNHVYATGRSDHSVTVFSRDLSSGVLTYVEVHKDGVGGNFGLERPYSVNVSPDGNHVYVSSWGDAALTVFVRNKSTGSLTFVESQMDGSGGVDGLDAANHVTVSPDGNHVYTTGFLDDSVGVFSRNSSTGTSATVTGLTNGTSYTFTVSATNGGLTTGSASGPSNSITPATVPGAPTGVTSTGGPGTTATISWTPPASNGGSPITLYTVTSSPDNLTATATGTSTTLTGFTYGTEYTFTVTATNSAGTGPASDSSNPGTFVTYPGAPTGVSATGGNGQATVSWTPPSFNGGAPITRYTITSSPGGVTTSENVTGITYVEMQKDGENGVDGIDDASDVAVSPDGKHVYVTSLSDHAVAVFSRNLSTGALTYVEMQKDGVNNVDGLHSASSVKVSPDGSHVYVVGANDHAVAVFLRNSSAGRLTYLEVHKDGVNGVDGLRYPADIELSPDGNHIYVAGYLDNAVSVFSRNSSTGLLTYVEMQKDGVNGVEGLEKAFSVAVSPDGNHVYVGGWADNAVAMFSRNTSTGALTYLEVYEDGVGGVDGLDGVNNVKVSPDGNNVYVAGWEDHSVAVFSRNVLTGVLTYVEVHKDGVGGIIGLERADSVAISPDGNHVYVSAFIDDAVSVFSRNSSTGVLTYIEMQKDGVNGVDGFDGASRIAISPEGNNVYVGGWVDDAVSVFSRSSSTGTSATVTGLTNGIQYRFVVTAYNGIAPGEGAASTPSNTLTPATLPGIPTGVSALGGDAQATVSWSAPASNGGAAITQYTVTSSPGGVTATTSENSTIVSGLTNGTIYTFTVTATNSTGTGSPSVASGSISVPPPFTFNVHTSSAILNSRTNAITAGVISGGTGTFTAQINWGDGTIEPATVTGNRVVGGNHTYASSGTYIAVITVTDSNNQKVTDSIIFTVTTVNATIEIPSVGLFGMGVMVFSILVLVVWILRKQTRLDYVEK